MAKFQKPICYNSTVTLFDIVKPGPFLSENRKENCMTYAYNDGGRKAAGYKGTTGDVALSPLLLNFLIRKSMMH